MTRDDEQPVVKRGKAATSAKARKLRAGEQGSFGEIRAALRAAKPTLNGRALSALTGQIFYGEKQLHAVILSFAATQ